MGTDKIEKEGSRIKRVKDGGNNGAVADWSKANPDSVLAVIALMAKKRGAVRFGCTRDGGALSVGIYAGPDYFTEYIRPNEDIDEYLEKLLKNLQEYTPELESLRRSKR